MDEIVKGSPIGYESTMALVPTIEQRLKHAVEQAEERLKQVKRAQEIFNKHPELEELLNIMQKSHF